VTTENAICLCFLPHLQKIEFLISQGSVEIMPMVRWVMSYGFCSKFRMLSSSAKILKICFDKVTDSLKVGTFLRHSV